MFKYIFYFLKPIRYSSVFLILTQTIGQAAELDCMIKPEMYIELSSPVAGVLEKILVDKGDQVKNRQAVAQLEASVEIAKVNQAKFEAANVSDINNRKAQLEFALRSRTSYRDLYQRGSLSQIEKDKAETEVKLAETELAKAMEQHKAAALALELAKAQLALKTIKSPIDGLVIDRYAMIGESVTEKAIMKLAQVDPLRVELVAPTEYFGLIQHGMQVKIRTERPANKEFIATVTIVDQLIDPASGSFSVRMSLSNPDHELIGGVNCIALFDFETPPLTSSSDPTTSAPIKTPIKSDK